MNEDSDNRPRPQQQQLDKDTFELWRINPVTRAYFAEFREIRDRLLSHLSSGNTLTGNAMETAEATALLLGEVKGINHLLEAYYEDEETGEIIDAMPN